MVYQHEDWGKEVLHDSSGLEVVEHHKSKGYFIDPPPSPSEPRILGLRRITLVLAVALVVAITGAAVAGGVGASMVSQCSRRYGNTLTFQLNIANTSQNQHRIIPTKQLPPTKLRRIPSNDHGNPNRLRHLSPHLLHHLKQGAHT
jgi:hypothetical protein